MEKQKEVVKLKPIEATSESFEEYGQVIEASLDGEEFGPQDAQLDLSRGIPRFYIMHLEERPLVFSTITHHASVTQCLGSIGGHVWYLGVAKPYPLLIQRKLRALTLCSHAVVISMSLLLLGLSPRAVMLRLCAV